MSAANFGEQTSQRDIWNIHHKHIFMRYQVFTRRGGSFAVEWIAQRKIV